MATENTILKETFEAAEDLSDYQWCFVVLNTSGKVRLANSANEKPIGVLQNAPESGEPASVCIMGRSKVVLGGSVTVGQYVKNEYNSGTDTGKAVAATGGTDIAMGLAVEGGSENELGSIILTGLTTYNHTTTTTTTTT